MTVYAFRQENVLLKFNSETNSYVQFHYYVYYGVLSPFLKDNTVLSTNKRKEAIFHTEDEIYRVQQLLKKNNIECQLHIVKQEPINIES